MERAMLLGKLTGLDFMGIDIGLYLNTHPQDTDAIAQYNKVMEAADIVREKYESAYGPLCSFRSVNQDEKMWQWIDEPWPWKESFNFNINNIDM